MTTRKAKASTSATAKTEADSFAALRNGKQKATWKAKSYGMEIAVGRGDEEWKAGR
jgi:hypothetical protein